MAARYEELSAVPAYAEEVTHARSPFRSQHHTRRRRQVRAPAPDRAGPAGSGLSANVANGRRARRSRFVPFVVNPDAYRSRIPARPEPDPRGGRVVRRSPV